MLVQSIAIAILTVYTIYIYMDMDTYIYANYKLDIIIHINKYLHMENCIINFICLIVNISSWKWTYEIEINDSLFV